MAVVRIERLHELPRPSAGRRRRDRPPSCRASASVRARRASSSTRNASSSFSVERLGASRGNFRRGMPSGHGADVESSAAARKTASPCGKKTCSRRGAVRIEPAALAQRADQCVAETLAQRRERFSFVGIRRFDPHVVERFAARFDRGENRREAILAREIAKMRERDQASAARISDRARRSVSRSDALVGGGFERNERRVRARNANRPLTPRGCRARCAHSVSNPARQ